MDAYPAERAQQPLHSVLALWCFGQGNSTRGCLRVLVGVGIAYAIYEFWTTSRLS
jgi:hypothetical protein